MTNPTMKITLQQRLTDIYENQHLIQFYAKANCRDCHGRGKRTTSVRDNNTNKWSEHTELCPCVKKAVKKELKELEETDG